MASGWTGRLLRCGEVLWIGVCDGWCCGAEGVRCAVGCDAVVMAVVRVLWWCWVMWWWLGVDGGGWGFADVWVGGRVGVVCVGLRHVYPVL